jgi:hypothetical protein
VKIDIGKSGKGIISLYIEKTEESNISKARSKYGPPQLRYCKKGKLIAAEWLIKGTSELLGKIRQQF